VTDGEWYRYLAARLGAARGQLLAAVRRRTVRRNQCRRAVLLQDPLPGQSRGGRRVLQRLRRDDGIGGVGVVRRGQWRPQPGADAGQGQPLPPHSNRAGRRSHHRPTVFIRDVRFFPSDESAPPPPDFAANTVQGTSYDLSREPAAAYFGDLIQRLLRHPVDIDLAGCRHWSLEPAGPGLRRSAAGSATAWAAGLQSPAAGGLRPPMRHHRLQDPARLAGIPYPAGDGRWRAQAGQRTAAQLRRPYALRLWLLRRGSALPLHVSPRLREEFGNGEQFYEHARQPITLPTRRADPDLRKGQQACVLNPGLRVDVIGDWPAVAGDGRWLGVDLVGEEGEGPREAGFGGGLEGDGDRG